MLDAGCGTGENALYLASLGFEVWGIDSAPFAIKKAKEKAKERGLPVNFLLCDIFKLQLLQNKFDTIIDCGLKQLLNQNNILKIDIIHAVLLSCRPYYPVITCHSE